MKVLTVKGPLCARSGPSRHPVCNPRAECLLWVESGHCRSGVTGAQSLRIRGTMNGVPVTVETATDAGRLYPSYKNSIGIFTLETELLRTCPIGVNIDGMLMLDFDEDRVLAGVELLLPMSGWKGKTSVAQPLARTGNIILSGSLSGQVEYDWPILVSKDVQRKKANISFG